MPEEIDCSSKLTEKSEADVSMFRYVAHRFFRHKLAVAGLIFVILIIICALLAPLIAMQNPFIVSDDANLAPYWKHILGTDSVGRDVFSRLIYGARVSLTVGILTVVISIGIGTVLGLLSGYFGGKTDMIIMRLTDMFMSFPDIMLILVIVSIIGPGLRNIIIVLGLLQWPGVTRIVRGNVLVYGSGTEHISYLIYSYFAQYHRTDSGLCDNRYCIRHHYRSVFELSGHGRAAPDAELGKHAYRCPVADSSDHATLALGSGRHTNISERLGDQRHRRRPQRCP